MEDKIGMQQRKSILYKKYVSTRQIIHLISIPGIKELMSATIFKLTISNQLLLEKVSSHSSSMDIQLKSTVGLMVHISQIMFIFFNNRLYSHINVNQLLS